MWCSKRWQKRNWTILRRVRIFGIIILLKWFPANLFTYCIDMLNSLVVSGATIWCEKLTSTYSWRYTIRIITVLKFHCMIHKKIYVFQISADDFFCSAYWFRGLYGSAADVTIYLSKCSCSLTPRTKMCFCCFRVCNLATSKSD